MTVQATTTQKREKRSWRWRKKKRRSARPQEIVPPEGVPVRFTVAGLGVRTAAQIVDILLTLIFVAAFLAILALAFRAPGPLLFSLGALLWLAMRAPYYIVTELLWNGETLGKRMMKIRVVSADGRSLTPHGVVVRNLMKEAEVFAPGTSLLVLSDISGFWQVVVLLWIAAAMAVPLLNRRRQRLGDLMGGTYVVHLPEAVLLPDLAAKPAPTAERHVFQPHQLNHYGAFELQTLEAFLHKSDTPPTEQVGSIRQRETRAAIVDNIRKKIDYPEAVPQHEHDAFLRAFYVAQRAHLEQRQLFGERRIDKHHAAAGTNPQDGRDRS